MYYTTITQFEIYYIHIPLYLSTFFFLYYLIPIKWIKKRKRGKIMLSSLVLLNFQKKKVPVVFILYAWFFVCTPVGFIFYVICKFLDFFPFFFPTLNLIVCMATAYIFIEYTYTTIATAIHIYTIYIYGSVHGNFWHKF